MRILQMARWFFPHQGGGTIRTYEIARNLVRFGNEVHLLVHHPKSIPHATIDKEVERYEKVEGIHVHRLPYIGPLYLYYFLVILLMAFFAIQIIRKNKIDIILSENPPYLVGASSIIASRITNIPMVIDSHDIWGSTHYNVFESKFGLFLEGFCCKRSDMITVANKTIKKTLNIRYGIPPEKVEPLLNATDIERFEISKKDVKNIRNKYKIPEDRKIVFFVGNIANWNGPEYLVKAVPHIKNKNALILIVGSGKQENELREIAKDYKNVIFTGAVPYPEVPLLMNLADVCVAPRPIPKNVGQPEYEFIMPIFLLEYMACGKPIVGVDISGVMDALSNGRGMIVEPENPKEIAKGIDYLLENKAEAKEMGSKAREYIKKKHSWVKVAKGIEKILLKVIHDYKT